MFEFRSLELMNWDYWPHFELPFDERIIMLAGPNGSGKTTFLDSLRLLLGAKTLSTGRKLSKYLRSGDRVAMVKGRVTNHLRHGKRPFRHLGLTTNEVTLVCLLENRAGSWDKRFAILPGNPGSEEIQEHEKWMGPEEYARSLRAAGLPRTLLKILALEQGETNKLCEKSPGELLKYLLEIQGDKQTLDRYSDALENYRASEKELFVQAQKAVGMERNLLEHERKATDAEQYHQRVAELERLRGDTLPKAIYKDIKSRTDELSSSVGQEESRLKSLVETRNTLDDEIARLLAEDSRALDEVAAARENARKLAREKEKLDLEYGGVALELSNLEKLRQKVVGIEPEDGEALSKQLEEQRRIASRTSDRCDELHDEVLALGDELRELSGRHQVTFPRDVEEMRRALGNEGIDHVLIAEMVEIREPQWRLAVESTLGGTRFAVVVNPEDSLRAREIARSKRYRYFVTEYEKNPRPIDAEPQTALSVTELARDDLPSWVVENLARMKLVESVEQGLKQPRGVTSITPDGYRQDRRGGAFVGVDRLYCGRSAASERVRVIEQEEMPQLLAQQQAAENQRELAERTVAELTSRLSRQRALAEWREKEALLGQHSTRLEELVVARREMTERIVKNDAVVGESEAERSRRAERRGELQARRERLEQERQTLERSLPAQRTRALAELEQLALMEAELEPEERSPEALADIPGRDVVESLISRLDDEVSNWSGCRDLAAKEVYEKIREEYDEFRGFLDARRNEHDRWNDELSLARRSYRRVVEQTVEFYRRAVTRLAEKAGFQIEVPPLALGDDDESLERAGLVVRVAYDGKHFVSIDDPDLSGGQSVLTSLVLLMGMTLADGHEDAGGFFILDEPFAHLSVERIDDVAAFLSATRSQFILTTPTTHNHNVFNPAHLTVALRKKKPGTELAPAPVFIRR